jgi:hypothetical protein
MMHAEVQHASEAIELGMQRRSEPSGTPTRYDDLRRAQE